MLMRQPADLALIQSQLALRDRDEPAPAGALHRRCSTAQGVPQPARPPLVDLLADPSGPSCRVQLSGPGRQQMGPGVVRQADGPLRAASRRRPVQHRATGAVQQAAAGSDPAGQHAAGTLTIQGAGRAASNIWIGLTPYLHTKVPGEARRGRGRAARPGPERARLVAGPLPGCCRRHGATTRRCRSLARRPRRTRRDAGCTAARSIRATTPAAATTPARRRTAVWWRWSTGPWTA